MPKKNAHASLPTCCSSGAHPVAPQAVVYEQWTSGFVVQNAKAGQDGTGVKPHVCASALGDTTSARRKNAPTMPILDTCFFSGAFSAGALCRATRALSSYTPRSHMTRRHLS